MIEKNLPDKTANIKTKADLIKAINNHPIFPATLPIQNDIGKYGLMWPRSFANFHPAAPMLHSYSEQGCPVDCGPPWTHDHIIAALRRGCHPSAKPTQAAKCLENETKEKIEGGFASIVTWADLKHNIPTNLKISPIAMIPHKSRRFRAILDLSFQLKINRKKLPSVNSNTVKKAPQKSMASLGETLKRIINTMATNYDLQYPFLFSKCDIKDGFWRMVVNKNDAWNFCYTLPSTKATNIDNIRLVVPHSLQMGWAESPPFFCAATETARDLIEALMEIPSLPPHNMEHMMYDDIPQDLPTSPTNEVHLNEVYVDDFIGCTNINTTAHLQHASRAMLHGIHSIFPPPSVSQHNGADPISEKKMTQHDGKWLFIKEILGWEFNGKEYTIQLPTAKSKKIQQQIKRIANEQKVKLNNFQQAVGKLNHAALGLPAGKGLCSPLFKALQGDNTHIIITPNIKQALRDWATLLQHISSRPTSVLELKPGKPRYISYVDASKTGVGGVWLPGTHSITPHVWRLEWPQDIQDNLISQSNPTGTITINDLEMAGELLTWLVLETISPTSLQYANIGIYCDNTPTVAWANRLSSSKSIIAAHLLRALALRQHVHRTSPILTVSIPGENNDMADFASRSFSQTHKNANQNTSFLSSFITKFPLQSSSWMEFHLPDKYTSRVISSLRGKPLEMALWTKITGQEKNTGLTGQSIAVPSTKNLTCLDAPASNKTSLSQHSLHGSGQATTAEDVVLKFKPLLTHYQPSPRHWNWLDNQAQSMKHLGLTESQWHGSWRVTEG
jgi:hypothetical protein